MGVENTIGEGINFFERNFRKFFKKSFLLLFENFIPNNEYISNNSSKLQMRQDYL